MAVEPPVLVPGLQSFFDYMLRHISGGNRAHTPPPNTTFVLCVLFFYFPTFFPLFVGL